MCMRVCMYAHVCICASVYVCVNHACARAPTSVYVRACVCMCVPVFLRCMFGMKRTPPTVLFPSPCSTAPYHLPPSIPFTLLALPHCLQPWPWPLWCLLIDWTWTWNSLCATADRSNVQVQKQAASQGRAPRVGRPVAGRGTARCSKSSKCSI